MLKEPFTIYETERQLTRALAAEIRHNKNDATCYFSKLLKEELGTLTGTACEEKEGIDILLTFKTGDRQIRVGIEAKIDHMLSSNQLQRERTICDKLVLLTLEVDDSTDFQSMADATFTWREILKRFDNSRVTVDDVYNIPSIKVKLERAFRAAINDDVRLKGWNYELRRGGSARPSVVITSPTASNDTELTGHIEVSGRHTLTAMDDIRIEYFLGTALKDETEDFPEEASETLPPWVSNALTLSTTLRDSPINRFRLRKNSPQARKNTKSQSRKRQIDRHLETEKWLAVGYTDWSLGVRSETRELAELDEVLREFNDLAATWYAAIDSTAVGVRPDGS